MDYPLGEVREATRRKPRTFMLDNKAFTLEADIPVACLALQIVHTYGCSAAIASPWRRHNWQIDLYELHRWRQVRCSHFFKEAWDVRIASEEPLHLSATEVLMDTDQMSWVPHGKGLSGSPGNR